MVVDITTVNLGLLLYLRHDDLKSVLGFVLALVLCRGFTLVPDRAVEPKAQGVSLGN